MPRECSKTRRRCGSKGAIRPRCEGDQLTFDHCILATGSLPAKIPALTCRPPRVMDSTGALELPDVPESLLVVGGGYIGLEMGTVYAELGTKVSVVELTGGLLPGADRDLVKPLHAAARKAFAGRYPSQHQSQVAGRPWRTRSKSLSKNPKARRCERFSRVLVSVGRKPNSAGHRIGKYQGRSR